MGGESEDMIYFGVFTKHPLEIARHLQRPKTPFNIHQEFNLSSQSPSHSSSSPSR